MSKITSITSSDEWNVVLYDDGTAVLVRRILSSAGDNPLTTHEQMVEEFREKLAQAERERDEARAERDAMRARPAFSADGDLLARLGQAMELLREARTYVPNRVKRYLINYEKNSITRDERASLADRIDAFTAGQPAPVYQAMARVCEAARDMRDLYAYDISEAMRDALADLERARKGEP